MPSMHLVPYNKKPNNLNAAPSASLRVKPAPAVVYRGQVNVYCLQQKKYDADDADFQDLQDICVILKNLLDLHSKKKREQIIIGQTI